MGPSGNNNKILVIQEVSNKYGALREPVEWQPVWNDRGSGKSRTYSCWLPVGRPEFVPLGLFFRFEASGNYQPTRDEAKGIVVVHNSLVEPCELTDPDIWNDHGTGARYDVTIGEMPHMAMWPRKTTDPDARILPVKHTLKKTLLPEEEEYTHTDQASEKLCCIVL